MYMGIYKNLQKYGLENRDSTMATCCQSIEIKFTFLSSVYNVWRMPVSMHIILA